MSDIFIYQTTHILLNIRSAKFEGIVGFNSARITFEARCDVLCLTNCGFLFKQPDTNIYERLIFNEMFEISSIFKARTKELFINNCTITRDVQLCNTLCKLHFYNVRVIKKNTLTIPEQCMNVIMRKSFGAFSIPGLNEHKSQVTMFFEARSYFHFSRYKGSDQYLLKIENCDIDGNICIRKEIRDIILSNVTFSSNRFPKKIDKRTIIDSISPQSLTLKSCLILYDATIHRRLTYLHLERMCFNDDIRIGRSIKKLILKDVTIKSNFSVVLEKNISYLEIYNFNGGLNFNGLLNLKQLCLCGNEKIVYEKGVQLGPVRLKIENLTFVSDYQVAEEVKILHLIRIKIKNDSKILVNRSCNKIVTSFEGVIYFIEESNIKKVAFINFIPLFKPGCWTLGASHGIEEIKTPSHLKSVRFKDIELRSVIVTINDDCEDVSIIHCSGKFNLAEIQNLSKLTLHPGEFESVFLTSPDLSHIEELDLAFDFKLDFFEHLLCCCFNVRILTLRTLTFSPNDSSWRGFVTSDAKPLLAFFENFRLIELKESLSKNFPSEDNTSSLWMLLNKIMNILIVPMFNTRSQLKLEVLKIAGFYFSNKNLERLSNFCIMKKLSVDYNFISIGLFDHLPPNLEILEILNSDIFKPNNKNSMRNEKNAETIKKMNGPRILIIEGSFFETPNNFTNLPLNLHTLKVTYCDMTSIVYEPTIEKIHLRELIVFFKSRDNDRHRFDLTSIEKKICIQEMLSYLGDFIDFNRLDSLMVEDGDESVEYDRFEIY